MNSGQRSRIGFIGSIVTHIFILLFVSFVGLFNLSHPPANDIVEVSLFGGAVAAVMMPTSKTVTQTMKKTLLKKMFRKSLSLIRRLSGKTMRTSLNLYRKKLL